MGRLLRLLLTVVIGLGVATGGLFAAGVIGPPSAGVADNDWGTVTNDSIEVVTTAWIDNPNPVGAGTGGGARYVLELGGVRLAAGETSTLSVPPGNTTTTIRTRIRQNRIPEWWTAHLRNNETSSLAATVTANVSIGPLSGAPTGTYSDSLDTDIDGSIADAMSAFEGEYTGTQTTVGRGPNEIAIQPTVEVTDTNASWGEVTKNRTEIRTTFTVYNPNAYPIPTPAFAGSMTLNNVTLGAWDASEVEVLDGSTNAQIPPQQARQVTFVVDARTDNVTEWFPTHIRRDEFSNVTITGRLAIDVSGSQVQLPRGGSAIQCQYDLQTAIFVDNQSSSLTRESCGTTPRRLSQAAIDRGDGRLVLTETDWWQSNSRTGSGVINSGGSSSSDDEGTQDGADSGGSDSQDDTDSGGSDGEDDSGDDDGIGLPTTALQSPDTASN